MVKLQADPFNLQGNAQLLQGGSVAALQPAGNPYGSAPVAPVMAPVAPKTAPRTAAVPKRVSVVAQPQSIDLSGKYGLSGSTVYRKGDNYAFGNEQDFFRETGLNSWEGIKLDTGYNPVSGSQVQPMGSALPGITPTPLDANQQLARSAAQAGLGIDDYLKLVSGQGGITPDERNQIRAGLGITDLENSVFGKPSQSTEEIYKNAYKSSGLGDLKKKVQAKLSQINDLQGKYTDKAGDINENPFLSEASRVGRLRILEDQRQAQIGNMQNELNSITELYNSGINEVNSLVTRVAADMGSQRSLDAQKLQYLLGKAEEQIKDKESANSASAYAYLPDYLAAKVKGQKPDTIGSAETGFFKWDAETGTFVQVTAPQPKLPASAQEYEYAKANGFAGSYDEYQTMDANRKRSITNINTGGGGLTPGQVNTTVNQIAGAFDNEPVVRQYNVINEGYQFAKSLSNSTKNPSDDQGLIYAFAKAMDPGSVVREGEYATVQKYAQSWVKSFGKGVEQAINGTGFLSETARANIKATIESKYKVSQQNYQQVYNEYQRQVQDAYSGNPRQITDYAGAYSGGTSGGGSDPLGLGI
jgi:hypothetical protein